MSTKMLHVPKASVLATPVCHVSRQSVYLSLPLHHAKALPVQYPAPSVNADLSGTQHGTSQCVHVNAGILNELSTNFTA